ncbi:Estradiol 17-beta-dehydrogenase 11, partial [Galemys pyrenaicus]
FAKLKNKLVLWARNKHGIAAGCRRPGAKAHTFVRDHSNQEAIASSAEKVKTEIEDAFLPAMMYNNHGHTVIVASAARHIVVPDLMAYFSSKFAAVGFHGALIGELAAFERSGVKTSCLCPNFVSTGFLKTTSTNLGLTIPEEVVDKRMMGP